MTIDWTSSPRGDAAFEIGAGFEVMLGTMNGMIEDFLDADLPPGATVEFELVIRRRETLFG